MKKQLTRFSVHQSSKVIALIYFILSAFFLIPYGIFVFVKTGAPESFIVFLIPFLYLLLGYIVMVIFCWVYNLLASSFGGIEFTLENTENKQ